MARRSDMYQGTNSYSDRNAGARSSRAGSNGRTNADRMTGEQKKRALTPREKVEQAAREKAQGINRRTQENPQRATEGYRTRSTEPRIQRASSRAYEATRDQQRYSEGSRTQRSQRSAEGSRSQQRVTTTRSQRTMATNDRSAGRVAGEVETRRQRATETARSTRTARDTQRSNTSDGQRRYRSNEARSEQTSVRESTTARRAQQRPARQVSEDGSVRRPTRRTTEQAEQGERRSRADRAREQHQQRTGAEEAKRVVSRETIEEQIAKRIPSKEELTEKLSDRDALAASAREKLSALAGKAQKVASEVKESDKEEKKVEERSPFILPSFFLGLVAALLVLGIVLPDAEFSQTENRKLQTFPAVSVESFADGTFQSEFQTYVEDQFPMRDLWVTIKSVVSTLSGRVENNGVYRCGDGTLILEFVEPENDTAAAAIVKFTEAHKDDMKIYTLIAPTAAGIWADKLPGRVVMDDQKSYLENINSQFTKAGAKAIDVWKPFEAKKAFDLYYRTDHHWTTYGAQLAYMNLANALDMNVSYKTYNDLIMTNSFAGSLTAQGGYFLSGSDELHVYLRSDQDIPCVITYASEKTKSATPFVSSALDERDAYEVFFGGNHSLIEIDCYAENSRGTLLIVKDSYANSLIPFLIGDYERIIVVDPRYYTEDLEALISSNNINDVLFLYNATTFAQDTSLGRLVDAGLASASQSKEN